MICNHALSRTVLSWLHSYPPTPCERNVPGATDPYSSKLVWLNWMLPHLFDHPTRRVDETCAENICRLWRVADKPDKWSPEFNRLQDHYHSWELAALFLRLAKTGLDFSTVLRDIRYGDESGWLVKPPQEYVFVHQKLPDTTEGLTELSKSMVKGCFGKAKDKVSLSVLDGPSTVPMAKQAVQRQGFRLLRHKLLGPLIVLSGCLQH